MQQGGCHPVDGCLDGDGFAGADFEFLAANVVDDARPQPLFPPYTIENFGGAKVAFIGMTLEGTPTIVSPAGIAGFDVPRRGRHRQRARAGAEAPGRRRRSSCSSTRAARPTALDINGCAGVSRARSSTSSTGSTDEVDLVVSGHTHQPYNCVIDGKPVTSAFSFGRLVTDIDMTVDPRPSDVTSTVDQQPDRHPRRPGRPGHHRPDRSATRPSPRRSPTGRSATSPADITARQRRLAGAVAGQRHRRRPAGRDRTTPRREAADRVHEPGRRARRPDRTPAARREGDGVVTYGEAVHRPAVRQRPR